MPAAFTLREKGDGESHSHSESGWFPGNRVSAADKFQTLTTDVNVPKIFVVPKSV